jgi:hypothetical protein
VTAVVRDARPPRTILRLVNPVLARVLQSPLGRFVKPLALIEFAGRRSGRRRRVIVGWHELGGAHLVFTPASWRVNFTDGAHAMIRSRGQQHDELGTLVSEPSAVADAINASLASGVSARALALVVPAGHSVTPEDVIATNRRFVRFVPMPADTAR